MIDLKKSKLILSLQTMFVIFALVLPTISVGNTTHKKVKHHKVKKIQKRNKRMVKNIQRPQSMNQGKERSAARRIKYNKRFKKDRQGSSDTKSVVKNKQQDHKQIRKPPLEGKVDYKFAERIKNGVKNGDITKKENQKLKAAGEKLKSFIGMAKEDGELTKEEKVKIRKMEDKYSSLVYQFKNNDNDSKKPPLEGKVDYKFAERIKDGVKNGDITKKENQKLKAAGEKLKSFIGMAKEDGELTKEEKIKIRKMEDKYSSLVYQFKNNDNDSKKPPLEGKVDYKFAERIKDGVKSGEINDIERKELRSAKEKLESFIKLSKKDGELTKEEKIKIRKMEDKYSSLVYQFKHNDESLAGNNENTRSPASDGSVTIKTISD
jgi:hypothetical protein